MDVHDVMALRAIIDQALSVRAVLLPQVGTMMDDYHVASKSLTIIECAVIHGPDGSSRLTPHSAVASSGF